METGKIGSLNVSIVGLGCNNFDWRLDYDHTVAVVDAALEAGINFLDTADIYGARRARNSSAGPSRDGATGWCSPPNSA